MPRSFQRRLVRLPAGSTWPNAVLEWADALLLVVTGTVTLEAESGRCWDFERGSTFWLDGLPVAAVRNRTDQLAVLMAISRRSLAEAAPAAQSDERVSPRSSRRVRTSAERRRAAER